MLQSWQLVAFSLITCSFTCVFGAAIPATCLDTLPSAHHQSPVCSKLSHRSADVIDKRAVSAGWVEGLGEATRRWAGVGLVFFCGKEVLGLGCRKPGCPAIARTFGTRNPFGTCSEPVQNRFGTPTEPVRDSFGTGSGLLRHSFGPLRNRFDTRSERVEAGSGPFGTRSEPVRDPFGTGSGPVRNGFGIGSEPARVRSRFGTRSEPGPKSSQTLKGQA